MKLASVAVFIGVCVVSCGAPVRASSSETPADCTDAQLSTAQKIIAAHEIETNCTTLKIDAVGVPDLTNLAFCSDEKCTKTIKRVRKSMPSCLYEGKRLRAGMTKLVKACEATASSKSGDDESGSDSPAVTTTPKTKKPKKTKTPAPSASSGSSAGSLIGEESKLIESESTIAPETTEPPAVAPTTVPTVAKTSTSASAVVRGATFAAVLSSALFAFLS